MLPNYMTRATATQKFTLLVGHTTRSSDPSKGESGNPPVIRRGFTCQAITTQKGGGMLGIFNSKKVSLIIKVNTTNYGNQRLGGAPPYYDLDYLQVYGGINMIDSLPDVVAGITFGQDEGEGAGAVVDVAAELAAALNEVDLGIKARVSDADNTQVEVYTDSIDDTLVIRVAAYSYKLFGGAPPFVILDHNGNTVFDPAVGDRASGVVYALTRDIDPIEEV